MDARLLSALLGFGLVLGFGACFIEPAPPASLRFECSSDSECGELEICAEGICQQPCGGEEDPACGQALCINNYCSNFCSLADDQCSDPQTCNPLVDPNEELPPGEEPSDTGVCTIPCSADQPCPEGQLCYEPLGFCLKTCMTSDECGQGEECLFNVCVPELG